MPERARQQMVEQQLAARDIRDERVLAAMRRVPREAFVEAEHARAAYSDQPLPIGAGQTISQPYVVAKMAEAAELRETDRVLEIGTGSGYAAAVLAELVAEVFTVERHAELARQAEERLRSLGYRNVLARIGDGTRGWPEKAPFDAIVVAAASQSVPLQLQEQLEIGGRLIIPVGEPDGVQRLLRIVRVAANRFEEEDLGAVRFVPLVSGEAEGEVRPPEEP